MKERVVIKKQMGDKRKNNRNHIYQSTDCDVWRSLNAVDILSNDNDDDHDYDVDNDNGEAERARKKKEIFHYVTRFHI